MPTTARPARSPGLLGLLCDAISALTTAAIIAALRIVARALL